jgi:hypothetical protein
MPNPSASTAIDEENDLLLLRADDRDLILGDKVAARGQLTDLRDYLVGEPSARSSRSSDPAR